MLVGNVGGIVMSLVGKVVEGIYLNEHEVRGTIVATANIWARPTHMVRLHHLLPIQERWLSVITLEQQDIIHVLGDEEYWDECDPYPPEEEDPSWSKV